MIYARLEGGCERNDSKTQHIAFNPPGILWTSLSHSFNIYEVEEEIKSTYQESNNIGEQSSNIRGLVETAV